MRHKTKTIRRGVLALAALVLPACILPACIPPVFAQGDNSGSPQISPLRDNVYFVRGSASNSGFVIGTDGVLVIDTLRTIPEAQAERDAIGRLTKHPVVAVAFTHSDPDHLAGRPLYPKEALTIAQENTRATIMASAADAANGGPFFGPIYQRLLPDYLPNRLVEDRKDATIAGVRVQFLHIAPGHSSGDLIVYLPDQKIVFGGDLVLTNQSRFPIIHIGGSSLGWIEAVKAILALDTDIIVPGHGPIETREQLQARLADAEKRRHDIKRMVVAGKSWEEVEAALPDIAVNPNFPSFTRTTYDELTKGYPGPAVPPWANMPGGKVTAAEHGAH
ncbi:MAG: MBL fold metallo-hydrolase [Sphingobium sp.]